MTGHLAQLASRRPWRTIALWTAVVAASLAASVMFLGSALTAEDGTAGGTESAQARALVEDRLPGAPQVDEVVIVRSARLTVAAPAFRARLERLRAAILATGSVAGARDVYGSGDRSLVSRDRRAALLALTLGDAPEDGAARILELVRAADGGAFDVAMTGRYTAERDFDELMQSDLERGELLVGLPAAVVVLLLVFGSFAAALVALGFALVSIVVAVALTALVGQVAELPLFVLNMITVMGLALGIDYTLFVVSRYREERARGLAKPDAIVAAGASAGRAVLVSGIAFVLALFGMVLVPDTSLRSIALGAILVGAVAVAAAVTLLPALLGLLGDRVNALGVPLLGRRIARKAGSEGRLASQLAHVVMRRPAASLVVATAVLLLAAAPALALESGAIGLRAAPDRLPSKQGLLALDRSFGSDLTEPAQIVVDGDLAAASTRAGVARLERMLRADAAFGPSRRQTSADGRLLVLSTPLAGDAGGPAATAAVQRLRAHHVPESFDGSPARVLVGGPTAETVDYVAVTVRWLPRVITIVLALTLLLLTLAFRSIVVAAQGVAFNLLSVGAAYGLLVLVFQKGVGSGLLGFQQVDAIEAWVPLVLFCVLFGLSMDYNVFLLSRIRERFGETGDTGRAVSFGVGSTARLITGAALIIVAVFSGFAVGELVMFQQIGFGVAVALAIDATIVRFVLVPASMHVLGDRSWYLPSVLEWLPRLEVESPRAVPSPALPERRLR